PRSTKRPSFSINGSRRAPTSGCAKAATCPMPIPNNFAGSVIDCADRNSGFRQSAGRFGGRSVCPAPKVGPERENGVPMTVSDKIFNELRKIDTPTITNVVATYPKNPLCLGLYNPWTENWYTDTSIR